MGDYYDARYVDILMNGVFKNVTCSSVIREEQAGGGELAGGRRGACWTPPQNRTVLQQKDEFGSGHCDVLEPPLC